MAALSKLGKSYIGFTAPLPYEIWNPKTIDVMIRMDWVYKELLQKLTFCTDEEKFYAGVQAYIFGGGMIEAWVNFVLWSSVTDYGYNEQGALFKLIEKNSIYEKLEYISGANEKFKAVYKKQEISSCIDMRNRLMHFKDRPMDVRDVLMKCRISTANGICRYVDVFNALIDNVPNAPIYDQIVDSDLANEINKIIIVYDSWEISIKH